MANRFYLLHRQGERFQMTKLDEELNMESVYSMTKLKCSCPRGSHGEHCKHLRMIGYFEKAGHVGDGYMFNEATHMWRDPILDKEELDGLLLGNKEVVIGQNQEDRLVGVVAPKLESEGHYEPVVQQAKEVKPLSKPAPIKRRRLG